jgi:hypothetical protein
MRYLLAIFLLLTSPLLASDATFVWTHQGVIPADSYSVYVGDIPGAYTISVTGIVPTSYTFPNGTLFQNVRNYVAFTAVSNSAGESANSVEINGFPRPVVTSAVPQQQAGFIRLTVMGANFSDGMGVSDAQIVGMTIIAVNRVSATQLEIDYTLDPGTPNDPADMTVMNVWQGADPGFVPSLESAVFLVPSLVPLPPIPTDVF